MGSEVDSAQLDHDRVHACDSSDPNWIDTVWLGFSVPERRVSGVLYLVMRPNRDVSLLGIYIWDERIFPQGDMLYMHTMPHRGLPGDLRQVDADGLVFRLMEPQRKYVLQYDDGVGLVLDLQFETLFPAIQQTGAGASSYSQPCHVRGTISLHGEALQVDCVELKAGAWGIRPDNRFGYSPDDAAEVYGGGDTYAFSNSVGFFLSGSGTESVTDIHHGYFYKDGLVQAIRRGQRHVIQRDGRGFPIELVVEAEDESGRRFRATGRAVNQGRLALGSWAMWMSGLAWEMGDESLWGIDHEVLMERARHFQA